MSVKHVAETILTSFLFLSRVWSRPSDLTCGGDRGEGDKWFDGCRWCVCQESRAKCSSSECSLLATLVPPCQNVGSRWWDGCYVCQCHLHGIECKTDPACVTLMRSELFRPGFQSQDGCTQPEDDRCICGVDGVPSCTAEVIDKGAYPTVTIELTPSYASSPSSAHPEDFSDDRRGGMFRKEETRKLVPLATFLRAGKNVEEHRSEHRFSNKERNGVNNSDVNQLKVIMQRLSASHDREGLDEQDDLQIKMQDYSRRVGQDATNRNTLPSILVASDNRCRWGVRWYGGSLRCYCGQDNSITCGDPSFVASRIDGFKLERTACEPGDSWNEAESCTLCECQVSGVALCRRSPTCPLPFLIAPHPEDAGTDSEVSEFRIHEQDHHVTPFSEKKEQFIRSTSGESNDSVSEENSDGKESNVKNASEEGKYHVYTSSDMVTGKEHKSGLANGETKVQTTTAVWTQSKEDQGDTGQDDGKSDSARRETPANSNEDSGNVEKNTENTETGSANNPEEKTEDKKRSKEDAKTECAPGSRWFEGCKRCVCSDEGVKTCDSGRCPKASRTFVNTTKPVAEHDERRKSRPLQLPPSELFSQRDHPVILDPYSFSCGRFKPGDTFGDDCNICVCTSHGPKCTAKNCT